MADGEIQFRVAFDSQADAQALAAKVKEDGASVTIPEQKGILPLAALLWVVVPPGLALLAVVINRIVLQWHRHGILIDARGKGAPILSSDPSLPYGTVIILTRNGDTAKRTDLPEIDLGKYIAAAMTAVSGGDAAGAAKKSADAAIAD